MFKKYFNFKWIGDNLGMIILIPTLIGGMWQVLELLMIGTAYIRFFSLSQVVPDGLLILLVLFMAFLISQMLFNDAGVGENRDKDVSGSDRLESENLARKEMLEENVNRTQNRFDKLRNSKLMDYLELIFSLAFLAVFIRYLIPLYSDEGFLKFFPLGVLLVTVFNAGLLLAMLRAIIVTIIRTNNIKVNFESKRLMEVVQGIAMVVVMGMFIGSFFFVVWFHNAFLMAPDMKNTDTLNCVVQNNNPNLKKYHVVYFNDNYIFIRVTPQKGHDQMLVLEFSAFFDQDACIARK